MRVELLGTVQVRDDAGGRRTSAGRARGAACPAGPRRRPGGACRQPDRSAVGRRPPRGRPWRAAVDDLAAAQGAWRGDRVSPGRVPAGGGPRPGRRAGVRGAGRARLAGAGRRGPGGRVGAPTAGACAVARARARRPARQRAGRRDRRPAGGAATQRDRGPDRGRPGRSGRLGRRRADCRAAGADRRGSAGRTAAGAADARAVSHRTAGGRARGLRRRAQAARRPARRGPLAPARGGLPGRAATVATGGTPPGEHPPGGRAAIPPHPGLPQRRPARFASR